LQNISKYFAKLYGNLKVLYFLNFLSFSFNFAKLEGDPQGGALWLEISWLIHGALTMCAGGKPLIPDA
jgi:hypothetical protein